MPAHEVFVVGDEDRGHDERVLVRRLVLDVLAEDAVDHHAHLPAHVYDGDEIASWATGRATLLGPTPRQQDAVVGIVGHQYWVPPAQWQAQRTAPPPPAGGRRRLNDYLEAIRRR